MKIYIIKKRNILFSKRIHLLLILMALGINISRGQVDGPDVRVAPSTNDQAEIHLSVSKVNPGNLIISFGEYIQPGALTWRPVHHSSDYGATWTPSTQPTPADGGGDPSTAYDLAGNAYVAGLESGLVGYWVEKSTDKGVTWSTQKIGYSSGTQYPTDKEMIAVDNMPNSPYVNNYYAAWSDFQTFQVYFQRSTDGTATFSSPIAISNGLFGQGTHIQTGRSGEVYVAWSDGSFPEHNLGFARSLDGGVTFPYKTNTAVSLTGTRGTSINGVDLNSFPSIGVDKSCGTYKDRIYMCYSENVPVLGANRSVVKLKYSDDKGTTWTNSNFGQEINILTASQSYFPWIAVDDANGDISIIYYSLDTYPNPTTPDWLTNTYVAHSSDGGNSFTNLKVSDVSHITQNAATVRYDYIGITAYGGRAYPAWMDERTGVAWQVFVSPINYTTPVTYSSSNTINVNGPATIISAPTSVLYEAVSTINCPAVSTVTVSSGAHTNMVAGTIVNILPGFNAVAGSNFYAYTGNVTSCTNAINRVSVADGNIGNSSVSDNDFKVNAFPNPFENTIDFEYTLKESSLVNLIIYNSLGMEVSRAIQGKLETEGVHKFSFNSLQLPSGFYSYMLQAGTNKFTGKLIKN